APWWRTGLLAVCAGVTAAALWLTHSRGAILGLGVVAVLGLALWQRGWLAGHKLLALGGLVAFVAAGWSAYQAGLLNFRFGKEEGGLQARLTYWPATVKMIADRPWWGVGPGNFGNAYPRYMLPSATEQIKDPHNFALEMWATAGLFALIGLVLALAM